MRHNRDRRLAVAWRILLFLQILFVSTLSLHAQSETLTVKGKVTNDAGEELPGVSIAIKGTTTGTISNIDGTYTIDVGKGQTLVFSFIGFTNQEFLIDNQTNIDVTMAEDIAAIEQVVVVGYGVQKKESVVGAIAQTKGEDLKQQGNISNLSDALAGAMPGVTVLTSTGVPGGGEDSNHGEATEILIRGRSTINNNNPLIMVDGVERSMNDIDINEVETISVLKDASATAVYGVRGANGVILITTKRGQIGKPKLSFEGVMSIEEASQIPTPLKSYDAIRARNIGLENEAPVYPNEWYSWYMPEELLEYYRTGEYPYAFADNNLKEKMIADYAKSYRLNMNVSGGTKFVKYFGSLSYNHTGDIMNTEDGGHGYIPAFKYDRINFRSNLDFNLTKTTMFSVNLSGMLGFRQQSSGSQNSIYSGIYNHAPDQPIIRYEDGTYGMDYETYERVGENEYVNLNLSGLDRDNRSEVTSDFTLNQKLDFVTKGLSIKGRFTYDNLFATRGRGIDDDGVLTKYVDPEYYLSDDPDKDIEDYTTYSKPDGYEDSDGFGFYPNPVTYRTEQIRNQEANRTNRKMYYQIAINYARNFGVHEVTGLALFSREKRINGSNFPRKFEDWVGRVTYAYDSRYLAEFNGSYNGTERFGPGYKFDFFPSLAVGWNLANESFFNENVGFVNTLKFRYSYGGSGNENAQGLDRWAYTTLFEKGGLLDSDPREIFGVNQQDGPQKYFEGTPGNPDLHWEYAWKQNIGVEFGFLNNLISGSAEYFTEKREDILTTEISAPAQAGEVAPSNFGEIHSNGFEVEIKFSKVHANSLSYYLGGNWTMAHNEIKKYSEPEARPSYQKEAGHQIGQKRTYYNSGIIESWDHLYTVPLYNANNTIVQPGDFYIADFNSDGAIDTKDQTAYGYSTYPLNTYGFNFGGSYKGFNVSVVFYGYYNVTQEHKMGLFSFKAPIVQQEIIDNTATPEYNGSGTFRYLSATKDNHSNDGHYYLRDASKLRLRTLELGYSLPKRWLEPIGVSALRLFVNGNNLWVLMDTPVDVDGRDQGDRNYPTRESWSFGLNLQF